MQKFKAWLCKTDDEGVSNLDAITTAILMTIAWGLIIGALVLR